MKWQIFFSAVALMLVFEGILPFLSPRIWRQTMLNMASRDDRLIRVVGFVSLLLGSLIMYLVHSGILN